jgi:hypothetical protein
MKGKYLCEMLKKTSVKTSSILLATAIIFGTSMYALDTQTTVPELVSFVDTDGNVEITADETPLGAPQVTTSTKTTKKTKKVKLKKASKKTYNKAGKSSTSTQTSSNKSGNTTTTTETVVDTSVLNKFKKGSKTQTVVTTTKTTITKTVVTEATEQHTAQTTVASASAKSNTASTANGTIPVASAAPNVDNRVSGAFSTLGFKITVNSSVTYSGLFDAKTRTITLKQMDSTVYHELGHFLAFIAGNVDTSSAFQSVYNQEKSLYTAYNKAYVLANSSEYFAESFKNYTENPSALKAARPLTYAAIEEALNKVTNSQVSKIATVYASVWG